ncbi:hypothetical protein PYW08_007398 [Mythimna loreyi]|uniref:Uncharacterized protein n=1 Tax=Mythimna loreyi TaxID=667449 RepID=A0ACC2QBN5_9NEOP|nr:hypothetical protein PYW08_007398 [Mythimna loreyi]
MDYSSTGAMRSPFSPRVRQSITGRRPIGLSSAKKNQSKFMQSAGEQTGDVVYKTPVTTIETYGMPLPVMVTEALTFASGEVSVRLSACGWCWVVSGRRIISWPRNSTISSTASAAPASTIARELSLPQTDLAHKADLVVLFYMEGAQMPSCIGVSPEGTVRYWPSVGQEGVYIDVSCELAGQECEKLGDYTPEGLVLATTTCTVVLLNPTVVDGRATVTCRTLRPPSGWLGGIGRRVSLLFFGSMPAHADTKLVGVVVLAGGGGAESTIALVSGGPALQLWRGAELHEHALRRALTDAHARAHLAPHGELNSLEIMALDVRASGNNALLLLIATVNVARSPEMRYAIAHICVEDPSKPRVTSVVPARGWAGEADEPPRFLPLAHRAILYTSKYIAIVSTTVANDKVDYIDVSSEGDKLLGAELCGGVPLLFSHKHGVLALSQPDAVHTTPCAAACRCCSATSTACWRSASPTPSILRREYTQRQGGLHRRVVGGRQAAGRRAVRRRAAAVQPQARRAGAQPARRRPYYAVSIHNDKVDYIDVSSEGDKLLGAELCGGVPLLFSHKHGVLALSQPDAVHTTPCAAACRCCSATSTACWRSASPTPSILRREYTQRQGGLHRRVVGGRQAAGRRAVRRRAAAVQPQARRAGAQPARRRPYYAVSIHNDKVDYIDVSSEGDKLLGAELCGGVPLLFSYKHGVLALSQPDAVHTTPCAAACRCCSATSTACWRSASPTPSILRREYTQRQGGLHRRVVGGRQAAGRRAVRRRAAAVQPQARRAGAQPARRRPYYAVSIHNDKVDYIDVSSEGDKLLGAELCGGVPLLFSHKHGVLALSQPDAVHTTPCAAACRCCSATSTACWRSASPTPSILRREYTQRQGGLHRRVVGGRQAAGRRAVRRRAAAVQPQARRAGAQPARRRPYYAVSIHNDKVDYIDVSSEGDKLLGAELCGGVPLLFSHKHGVLALSQPDAVHTTPCAAACRCCSATSTACWRSASPTPSILRREYTQRQGGLHRRVVGGRQAAGRRAVRRRAAAVQPQARRAGAQPARRRPYYAVSIHNDKVDYIDVSSEGDKLLGAELCGGVPLLFSHKHGVLALSQPDAVHTTPCAAACRCCSATSTACWRSASPTPSILRREYTQRQGGLHRRVVGGRQAAGRRAVRRRAAAVQPQARRAGAQPARRRPYYAVSIHNDKVDYIDVSSEGDKLLGAELCGGVPLLFSHKHGVLALSQPDAVHTTPSMCESPMGSPCPSDMYDGNLSLYEIDPHEVSLVTTDACGKLKTAFLFHVRRDAAACRALLAELFPRAREHDERDVDSVLDRSVLRIATDMLDDIPAGDPRWKQRGGAATNICLGSSAALQVAAQLRDKQRAFSLFCDFLRAVGLWQRLGLVTRECGGGVVSTESALCGLAEQLCAAAALRRLQQGPDAQLIDAAIYQVVCGDNPEVEEEPEVEEALSSGALSPGDVCYRRVSRVSRVLRALALAPPPQHDARAQATHAAATINILTSVLSGVAATRAQWAGGAAAPALGPRALLPALGALLRRGVLQAAHQCPDATLRAQVYEAAATLADLILTDAEHLNASSHTQHVYERIRREAIQPFIDEGQTERAAALAEKFKDFELLIEMCIKSNDLDKLFAYIDKYSNEGIASVTFASLADGGGARAALLLRAVGARCAAPLRAWLRAAPARTPLLALHELSTQHYARAAEALLVMANEELDSVNRLTTTASLAKLCLVASDEPGSQQSGAWQRLESRLALAEQHAALPRDIRLHHGLDAHDTKVLPPEDVVQMYIDSESKSLTEYDYKKALDLTDYIQDMERRDDLRLRVWCACIRRDDWSSCRVEAPADELHNKMFFRLIDLVHVMGGDLELLLPPVEDILTAPELAELVSDSRFHFIIKYGYECVDTTRNDSMNEG